MIARNDAVELVHWPIEAPKLERLRAEGRPRLLVIGPDTPPPRIVDPLEDWARQPAPVADIEARVEALGRRSRDLADALPRIDGHGVVTHCGQSAALGPIAAALACVLIERFGLVVTREELVAAAWPTGLDNRNSFDVALRRVRKQIRPLGLDVLTVRSRGYRLSETRQEPGTT